MIMKQVLWILLAFVLLCACEEKAFYDRSGLPEDGGTGFSKEKEVLEGNPGNLFAVFDSPMSVEEREALTFLYAYSPLIDLSFRGRFSVEERALGISGGEAMPWGKIFRKIYSVILYFREGWKEESGHGPYRFLQRN